MFGYYRVVVGRGLEWLATITDPREDIGLALGADLVLIETRSGQWDDERI